MKKDRRAKVRTASRLDTIADVGNVGDFMRAADEDDVPRGGPRQQSKRPVSSALEMATGAVGRKFKKRRVHALNH
jgi:hypothetical protein|eukprot:18746-Heterococcus_DN1.PRE.2